MPNASLTRIVRTRLRSIAYKSRRFLGQQPATLASVAQRSWQLAPGIDEPPPPIYIKESHVNRIQSGPFGESRDKIIRMIKPPLHRAAPSTAYQLRDVTLSGGYLFSGMYRHDLFPSANRHVPAPIAEIDSAVFTGLYASARWFGHLLSDEIPLQMLVREMGNTVSQQRRIYPDEPRLRELFGVPAAPSYAAFHAAELIMVDDIAQNPSKRARYQEMRDALRHLTPGGHERIYLRRNAVGGEKRELLNEADLLARLEREGFKIIEPGLGIDELIRVCMHAKVVMNVEGSHSKSTLYTAADGAGLMALLPPKRVSPQLGWMAWAHGLRGALFICEPAAEEGTFMVNVDEVMQTLDDFLRTTPMPAAVRFQS